MAVLTRVHRLCSAARCFLPAASGYSTWPSGRGPIATTAASPILAARGDARPDREIRSQLAKLPLNPPESTGQSHTHPGLPKEGLKDQHVESPLNQLDSILVTFLRFHTASRQSTALAVVCLLPYSGRTESLCFRLLALSRSKANEGSLEVPLITNGTTVTDFFFINGPSAFNTNDLNPDFVSARFPLV